MLAYLSLGSNLGDKTLNINRALELIEDNVGHIVRKSELFYSEPWGFVSENSFVNLCVAVETSLKPTDLLHCLQKIELMLGRKHKTEKNDGAPQYADRLIDIDILLYEDVVLNTEELVIPHPLMHEREFVMIPLNEILQ